MTTARKRRRRSYRGWNIHPCECDMSWGYRWYVNFGDKQMESDCHHYITLAGARLAIDQEIGFEECKRRGVDPFAKTNQWLKGVAKDISKEL